MKKKLLVLGLTVVLGIGGLVGCGNRQVFDTVYTYEKAILSLPNGEVIEGKVQSWSDYDDGDQIQVKINDVYYLIHSEDIVLITK